MTPRDVLFFITPFVLLLLGWVFAIWQRRIKAKSDALEKVDERLASIENKLAELGVQVSPLWAAVQSKIAKDLTHPHAQFKEMDRLLRDLENLTISHEGRRRLGVLLEERIISQDPLVSDDEKMSARLMKDVMEKVIDEAKALEAGSELSETKLVAEVSEQDEEK